MSNKHNQKRPDNAKKSTTGAIKTASKRAIQKPAEATGDLIDNKIADKLKNHSENLHKVMKLIMKWKYQKKDTYLQKKDNKLLMN